MRGGGGLPNRENFYVEAWGYGEHDVLEWREATMARESRATWT